MILKHQIRFLIFNICFFIGAYCNAENNSRSAHVLDTVPSNEKLYTTNQLDILPFLVCKYQRDTKLCGQEFVKNLTTYLNNINREKLKPNVKHDLVTLDTAILSFTISPSGKTSHMEITKANSVAFTTTFETFRNNFIQDFTWIPGRIQGNYVSTHVNIPIKIVHNVSPELNYDKQKELPEKLDLMALEKTGVILNSFIKKHSMILPPILPQGAQIFHPDSMAYVIDGRESTDKEVTDLFLSGEYKSMHIQKDKSRMIVLSKNHSKQDLENLNELLKNDTSGNIGSVNRELQKFFPRQKYIVDGVEMEESRAQKLEMNDIGSINTSYDPTLYPVGKFGYTEIFTKNYLSNKTIPLFKMLPDFREGEKLIRLDVSTVHFAIPLDIIILDTQDKMIMTKTFRLKAEQETVEISLPNDYNGDSILLKSQIGNINLLHRLKLK